MAASLFFKPVDGSPGHRVTEGETDGIRDFHWTADNKTLDLLRFPCDSDLVLWLPAATSRLILPIAVQDLELSEGIIGRSQLPHRRV